MTSGRPWRKATASGGSGGGGCVEVRGSDLVEVRDSKDPDGPVLRFTPHEWACFLDGARKGEFDDLN